MGKKSAVLLVTMLILSAIVMGCTRDLMSSEPLNKKSEGIKIGVFQPLTGGAASGGKMTLEGIQLANELFPEVLGKKVELIVKDNQSSRFETEKIVTELVQQHRVDGMIGSYGSSLSMAAGEVAKKERIPVVGCSPTNPLVTLDNDYYFRVCFIDPFQGTVMANYAVKELGAKRAIIIQDMTQEYSTGLSKFFAEAFIDYTGDEKSIVLTTSYHSGSHDFKTLLESIQNIEADVIFAPGNYLESALLIKQARSMGIEIPILGGDTWEAPDFITIGGDAVNGAAFSTHFTAEAPITGMSNMFIEKYKEKYNKVPSAFAALGFDAYLVMVDAIRRAGNADPEKIRDALSQTKEFEGVTGIITLDMNGDATKGAVIKRVDKGSFKYVDFVHPVN